MSIVDINLTNYLNNLYLPLEGKLGEIQKAAYKNNLPIIPNDVVKFLEFLLFVKKPKNVLEIGMAVGFSASFISNCLDKDAKITTIERYPLMVEKAKKNIKKLGLENRINIIEGDANDILKTLNQKFDFIFMDAAKGQYINILPDVLRLLDVGGIIFADDVLQNGTIAKDKKDIVKRQRTIHTRLNDFLYEITHNSSLKTSILTIGDGVAVCFKTS